ncbi:hypothetical protein EVAR_25332_1 [Eumeta japonica]|uniref:Uncharacterized protein n=1 Tax=Eumeta variegata TaxID=151549 RepID=A0A4C1XWM5_EUMVA|nr:hypothetical protein EVAR_25332_1 [Eumeta japonica]
MKALSRTRSTFRAFRNHLAAIRQPNTVLFVRESTKRKARKLEVERREAFSLKVFWRPNWGETDRKGIARGETVRLGSSHVAVKTLRRQGKAGRMNEYSLCSERIFPLLRFRFCSVHADDFTFERKSDKHDRWRIPTTRVRTRSVGDVRQITSSVKLILARRASDAAEIARHRSLGEIGRAGGIKQTGGAEALTTRDAPAPRVTTRPGAVGGLLSAQNQRASMQKGRAEFKSVDLYPVLRNSNIIPLLYSTIDVNLTLKNSEETEIGEILRVQGRGYVVDALTVPDQTLDIC